MKRLLSFLLAILLCFSTGFSYIDTKDHWAREEIESLSKAGILTGFEGYFRPSAALTRGEAAVIIDRIMNYTEESDAVFIDLETAFYTDAVLKCHAKGVLEGYEDRIRPLDVVTREEAAALFCRAFSISPKTADFNLYEDGTTVSRWAEGYLGALIQNGTIEGHGGLLRPKDPLSRGEAAKILVSLEDEIVAARAAAAIVPVPEEEPPAPPIEEPEEDPSIWEEEFPPDEPDIFEEILEETPEEVPEETRPVLETDTVLAVEIFTIGGGYLLSPRVVSITEGETAASLFARVLPEYNLTPHLDARSYLSAISGNIPVPSVPAYLVPHLTENMFRFDETDFTPGTLSEFDITNASGWMFSVNGTFPSTGLAETPILPGDTVRLMYTLARGADVGDMFSTGYYPVADRTAQTRHFASLPSIPAEALETMTRLTASREELDALMR